MKRACIHLFAAALCFGGCECGSEGADEQSAESEVDNAEGVVISGDPAVPGIDAPDVELVARLAAALEDKADGYEPRTHHLEEDGAPTYTNRLILQGSPYLLQHAHNPVNWFPWGEEAFERARRENKPVLLSVGYSTCHWCHVMERESFEDVEIAEFMNRHFIAIKVDREERPDIDDIYMRAVNMMVGRGGWPMTVVMTPDKEPFFGGTYFPPRTGVRGARRGFIDILRDLSERYESERDTLVSQAQQLSQRMRDQAAQARPRDIPGPRALDAAARFLAGRFDPRLGGFGRAPKFPQPSQLSFLLRYHRRTGDDGAKRMVVETLHHMARGGIRDHVGGGFHRYSVDAQWLVPHFEKMLYDNAQLAVLYLEAWQVSGDAELAAIGREILDYVAREMTAPEGGFYSATDADSPTPSGHEEEGWFFTWTPDEIRAAVPEQADAVIAYYGVTPGGNFEGRTILNTPRSLPEVATQLGTTPAALSASLATARQRMYELRARRPPPLRDDKILSGWNGLMISAFARAGLWLDETRYVEQGERAMRFLLEQQRDDDDRLRRSHKDGQSSEVGFLDDYALVVAALLDLYEATGTARWLQEAIALTQTLNETHYDSTDGGYFTTSHDHEQLLVRDKPSYDGAVPSGNSVAIENLLRLHELTGEEMYTTLAVQCLRIFADSMSRGSAMRMLGALDFYLDVPWEIVLVSPEGTSPDALRQRLRTTFLPNRVLASLTETQASEQVRLVPLLEGKVAIGGRPTAYVCERGRCELPTSDPDVFASQIQRVRPLFEDGRTLTPLSVPAAP